MINEEKEEKILFIEDEGEKMRKIQLEVEMQSK